MLGRPEGGGLPFSENVTTMKRDPHALVRPTGHVTIRHVAKRAGVGAATVSRVLNNGSVSTATRARVVKAIEGLKYHPDAVARGLRSRVTRTIGFIVTDVSNPLFASIMRGAARIVREEGYGILLGTSDGEPAAERAQIRLLNSHRVDGMILCPVDDTNAEIRALLESLSVPLVLIDRQFPGLTTDAVLCDHRTGWMHAATYLQSIGHRRIALVMGRPVTRPNRERISAVRDALEACGTPLQSDYLRMGPASPEFGEQATSELLGLAEPPTAIMVGHNKIAPGVLGTLRARHVGIPHQISLIVADDVDVARLNNPAITVVARDMIRIGVLAGQLLLERLTTVEEMHQRQVLVPTQLVVRDSCAPPAGS
jgi:LacI family transcriptional regulator